MPTQSEKGRRTISRKLLSQCYRDFMICRLPIRLASWDQQNGVYTGTWSNQISRVNKIPTRCENKPPYIALSPSLEHSLLCCTHFSGFCETPYTLMQSLSLSLSFSKKPDPWGLSTCSVVFSWQWENCIVDSQTKHCEPRGQEQFWKFLFWFLPQSTILRVQWHPHSVGVRGLLSSVFLCLCTPWETVRHAGSSRYGRLLKRRPAEARADRLDWAS